ncbi:MAG: response regulator [Desulfobulbaceae bacterium]|nr:MAG: response regulator [Desulfobulbaceae bacterium]
MPTPLSYDQELLDAIPLPMFLLDLDGAFIRANQAFHKFIGFTDEDIAAQGVYELLDPDNASRHRQYDHHLLRDGSVRPYEGSIRGTDRIVHSVVFRKSSLHSAVGEVTGIVTNIVDLTDLKNIERALVASESQKKAILDGFPGLIILFDSNLSAVWVNDNVWQRVDQPIGNQCHHIICGHDRNCRSCTVPESLRSGKVTIGVQHLEAEDGSDFYYEVIGTPVKDELGDIESVIVIAREITDRFKLEKQLRHAQKMEAIGTLAGGIAHDFNNVLTPILGYSEILKLKATHLGLEDETFREYIDEILQAGKRAKNLVEQILAFSRASEQKESLQYIHPIVKEVIKLMRVSLPTTIQITQEIDEKCGAVSVDPVQIHQVLINLCTNSADAIGNDHGTLHVRLGKAPVLPDETEQWVELCVEDSGCGMSKELLDRVFDPYFTTKEKGRGTGMGLSLVHSIITRHGGRIDVVSEPGVGTKFSIFLPPVAKDTTFDQVVKVDEVIGGEGNILLVDDEPQVVSVTGELLKSLGYRVTGLESSIEALSELAKNPDDFDLLLTDLTMPRLTGIELCREVKKIRPDIPVLLFTGYSERLMVEDARDAGIDEHCLKPVSLRDLSRLVKKLIGTSRSASQ